MAIDFDTTDMKEVAERLLLPGAVGVLRTDTLYGLVARANDRAAVERIYSIKQRASHKPLIVLIASKGQLFDIPSPREQAVLDSVWPGKVSIIVASQRSPDWIHRSSESVAYRLPDDEPLRQLLSQTGPLVAPSANPEGLPPATTIAEAKAYFGDTVDFYVDGKVVTDTRPSRLIRVDNDGTQISLR